MPNHLSARELVAATRNTKPSPAAHAILESCGAGAAADSPSQTPEQNSPVAKRLFAKPMPSVARLEANRANAAKSTGPKSPAGKARASRNATKHGLLSAISPLLNPVANHQPAEPIFSELTNDPTGDLSATIAAFTAELAPVGPLEIRLVARLASLDLRLARINRIESGLFATEIDSIFKYDSGHQHGDPTLPPTDRLLANAYSRSSRQLNLLSFYESRLSREFHRTLQQLRQTQALRSAFQPNSSNEPVAVPAVQFTQASPLPSLGKIDGQTNPTGPHPFDNSSLTYSASPACFGPPMNCAPTVASHKR